MLVQLVNDLEIVLLEKLLPAELGSRKVEAGHHRAHQLLDQETVALFLNQLALLYSRVCCGVEEVVGGHGVGEKPEDYREGEFSEGDHQNDGVGDELEEVDLDPAALEELKAGEVLSLLAAVESSYPLGVGPEVLRALHDRVLCLLPDELQLEPSGFLALAEELLLHGLHLLVVEQAIADAVGQAQRPPLSRTLAQHQNYYQTTNLCTADNLSSAIGDLYVLGGL